MRQHVWVYYDIVRCKRTKSHAGSVHYMGSVQYTVTHMGSAQYTVAYMGSVHYTVAYMGSVHYTVVYMGSAQYTVVYCISLFILTCEMYRKNLGRRTEETTTSCLQ